MWARAMYTYDKVAKNIGPKKEALAQAEGELAVVQSELGKKQDALRKVGAGQRGQTAEATVAVPIVLNRLLEWFECVWTH